jgi:glycosyltransferase involved in cell wall biosynthesis
MPGIVDRMGDVAVVGIGDRKRLAEFSWSKSEHVQLVECRARRYSLAEQVQLPLAIPHETDLFFSPYYTVPLLYRGRLAVTVHDLSHRVVPEIISNPGKRVYAQIMYRSLRRRASVIFTVSQFSKTELLRFTKGPREDNIFPTHLGVSAEWSGAGAYPRVRERPYFLYVGNVKPYKNLRRLVEAFLSVRDRIPHDLVIVGQSEGLITGESPVFFNRVQTMSDRIVLTGYVSDKDLLSLVGNAEALVTPSLYEGFGLPPLEAMAAGTPIAVARAGSLPEVCGEAALYFDPLDIHDIAEKLVRMASDPRLREELKVRGLERSKMFRWEECSMRTVEGLRGALFASHKN